MASGRNGTLCRFAAGWIAVPSRQLLAWVSNLSGIADTGHGCPDSAAITTTVFRDLTAAGRPALMFIVVLTGQLFRFERLSCWLCRHHSSPS